MKRLKFFLYMGILFSQVSPIQAQEYPIIFLGANLGYGWNEMKPALAIKGFLRYSVEAYIPGLQIEGSYSTNLFKMLNKEEYKYEEDDIKGTKTSELKIHDHQIGVSASFHLRPFGKAGILYLGGGGNVNFLSADSTLTDKYWDDVAEKEQEKKEEPVELFRQVVLGYHVLGGLRFVVKGGTIDIEVRKAFLTIDPENWNTEGSKKEYGEKRWGAWSINLGFTFNVW